MNRVAALAGTILVIGGLGVFAVKALVYDLPLTPADVRGLWQVSLHITVRGDGRGGSVSALLPSSGAGQLVLDERASSDRLRFSIRSRGEERIGVWTGRVEGVHELLYTFQVQTFGVKVSSLEPGTAAAPDEVRRDHQISTATFPAESPAVQEVLDALVLPPATDPLARLRSVFAFVHHEIATVDTAGEDALLVLAQREGSPEGKERLLVTMLRAVGIPARLVRGLILHEGAAPHEHVWTQAWLGAQRIPLSATDGHFAERPPEIVLLGSGDRAFVEATGVSALGHRAHSLREHLRPGELAALMAPGSPLLASLSLYQLPLATQSALRLLLLLPIGALIVAVFRNVIGVPTYGTFMPVLIAFALRGTPLALGLGLVGFVLGLGVVVRLALERLRLLMVPRLSILLCLVVLSLVGLALAGGQGARELARGVLFPIVILTMLVERFSIAIAEEGWQLAFVRAGYSILVAVAVYPAFQSTYAEHIMFSFPELVLTIMGLLVWIGAYTGYRVSDLLRFRVLVAKPTEDA